MIRGHPLLLGWGLSLGAGGYLVYRSKSGEDLFDFFENLNWLDYLDGVLLLGGGLVFAITAISTLLWWVAR